MTTISRSSEAPQLIGCDTISAGVCPYTNNGLLMTTAMTTSHKNESFDSRLPGLRHHALRPSTKESGMGLQREEHQPFHAQAAGCHQRLERIEVVQCSNWCTVSSYASGYVK